MVMVANQLSGILRHDSRTTSYKLALIRAINDVVLAYPTTLPGPDGLLIPLRHLASWWVAYYWPFVDQQQPLYQGARNRRGGVIYNDIGFRPHLTELHVEWAKLVGGSRPSDGFYLRSEIHATRRHQDLPFPLLEAYHRTIGAIMNDIRDPIRYAGQDAPVFPHPQQAKKYRDAGWRVVAIPDTLSEDVCLLLSPELWETFCQLSLWVEALCIHEWCLFTESVRENQAAGVERGAVYMLLTSRPDNRRPLTWERNHINLLLEEGRQFTCPWTGKRINRSTAYDVDHIIPIALYPINEMWNLVPADPAFNSHQKRDRLPSARCIHRAAPLIEECYLNYFASSILNPVLCADAGKRFQRMTSTASLLTVEVVAYVTRFGELRNPATFETKI